MNHNWELLEELCAVHAVAGREDRMVSFLGRHLRDKIKEVEVDHLGNVVATVEGAHTPDRRLLLQAHMDELGLIVRNISEDGFLLVERVGGVPEKSLLGQRVEVLTEEEELISGYVGAKSHHITRSDEKFVVPRVHAMYIDVGLPNRSAVEQAGIQVGDPIAYSPNFHRFGDGQISSKALDNRVGVFTLLEVLDRTLSDPLPCTVVFAFTVLEEFSIRGSLPVVTRTDPSAVISVDITIATDTPTGENLQPVGLRHGPCIKLMDFHGRGTLGGLISSPPLRRFIEGVAAEVNIPLQREVIVGVITDPAFQLYLGQQGYSIAGISIPQRYSHSSISMCHERDIDLTIQWIEALVRKFDSSVDLRRGIKE